MTSKKSARFAGLVVAGGLALSVPFLVAAQSAPGTPGEGPQARAHMMKAHARDGHERHHGMRHGRGMEHGLGMEHGMRGGEFGLLRGLDLTEEQRDRIFQIRHASEPAFRDQAKALRGARGEFAKLALSSEYDEAQVKALAERTAQAMSNMAQLRARNMNEVFRVLTPEQQAQVKERQARWEERGMRRGMRGEGRRGGEAAPAAPRS